MKRIPIQSHLSLWYNDMGKLGYHYVKSVQKRSFSGLYFPVFGRNTGKYEPEKTP